MKYYYAALAAFLFTGTVFGQRPTFVAADVHAAPGGELPFGGENLLPANRIVLRGLTLARLIALAYGMDTDKISGGGKWLDVDRFDVIAKPPSPTATQPELRAMLQALLAERFQLKVKLEDRPAQVYVWSPTKNGLRLTPSKSETDGDCEDAKEGNYNGRVCRGVTIDGLARELRVAAGGYFDRNVVDRTGAKGRYDFALKWSGKGALGRTSDAISLYDVLEKQYGIKMDLDTVSMPAIVVEIANEIPTPNPPGTDSLLPPIPTEFEVANVKINKDRQQPGGVRFVGGRLDAVGAPMKSLIEFAYGVVEDDMLMGAPAWTENELYDIVAKTDPSVDFVGIQPMLQKLLAERFHLKVHRENRAMDVFALTQEKSGAKLDQGDPSARGGCKRSVNNGLITFTCQNTTMAEFAQRVRNPARGYVDRPVVDLTGLKDAYNFAVSWNGMNITFPRGSDDPKEAADLGSGITFFTGLEKIGLKMAKEKRPMPVLVVDEIARVPVEN